MKPKHYRKVLKNGMTVIFEQRNIPVVAVSFAVRCGGINESEDEKGISHFIEHMLYKGTKKRTSKQISDEIEKNGGILNGFTDEEITAYWCKMPSKKLKVALDVLSDMVKNPLFDKKELDKERNVIFEEIKMRKDEPKTYVFDRIQSCLFGGTLGKDLIGTHETMSSITREKMVHRFKEVYHPNNMILCVVGDANFEDLCSFAEKNFPLTNGEVKAYPFSEKNKSVIEKRKGVDQANFVFAFHAPKAKDKKSFAMEALITLMAQGSSSRLFQEIREKRNLAYGVKGATSVSRDHAYGVVYVGTSKDKVGPVRNIIIQEFKKAAKNITKSELERVKEQMIGIQQVSMEDSSVQMTHLLLEEINGTFEESYRFEGNVRKITLDEVRKLAKQVSEKYSFFALIPN